MKRRKLFKRIIFFLFLLVAILLALPFLLKDTLIKKYVEKLNHDYNVNIAYRDVDISLFKNFPSATLTINDLNIITENPFKGDTLLFSKSVFLDINIKDVFKKDIEKIKVVELTFYQTKLNLLVNKEGVENYNIAKKQKSNENNTVSNEKEALKFEINHYNLKQANIIFDDKKNKTFFNLINVNHKGKGDFSANQTDLITKTKAKSMTLKIGNVTYFNKVKVDLEAVLGIDFEQNKYILKENKAKINDLDLSFDGFVKINKNDIDTDISFNSPKANFKSVLSLIPSAYSNNFKGVTANGIAQVMGKVKGKNSDTEIPTYHIKIKTKNASFKYPDLPKEVTSINFDGAIINNSSKNNVFLEINNLQFTIDQDTFETRGKITNLIKNPTFDTSFKGTLNLENLTQAYPIKLDKKLTGILKADFTTHADQNSVKNNVFDKIKTNGTASLQNFSYDGKDVANTVFVKNASVKFNSNTISLTDFNAKTGKSDIKATGTLDNLYAFIFDKKDLKGDFNVISENFVVSDFLVDENNDKSITNNSGTKNNAKPESLKIPDFLDVTSNIKAKRVVYDDLILNNVSGTMQLKDQKAILTNVKAKMLKGDVAFNGIVNTKNTPSDFNLDLLVNDFDIANSFTKLETFKKIIPIAHALNGKYDTSFKIKGNLNDDFSPNINTVNGNALAQLFISDINKKSIPLFKALTTSLSFIDLNKLNLEQLKTDLIFKNGRVSVKPFDLKYKDITMHISGNHGFDKSLQYNLKMDLPAKYLGNDAANLLAKLTNVNKDTITVPFNALITGSVLKPNVKANFKQAIKNLAIKVAKYQKDELVNQATGQVNNVINDVLENNGIIIPTDSTSTTPTPGNIINDGLNGVINGIFGGKKKKKDTIN